MILPEPGEFFYICNTPSAVKYTVMKLILLAPLAFLMTSAMQHIETSRDVTPAMNMSQKLVSPAGAPPAAERQLLGEWRKLSGELDCRKLVFYENGGLDIRMENKLLSTVYEITLNGVPLQGRILAWRGQDSPERPFTIRFLSPSEIEFTLLSRNKRPKKAVLRKQGDFRAGPRLLR